MKPFQDRGIFNKKNNPNLPSEEQKVFPSKYIQMKYPFLNEVVPKNSILYKVKYKPDFSTNEYIKNTKIDSFQSINLTNKKNYIIQNKNFEENTNSTLLNELEENKVQNQYYNNIDYNILDNNFYDNKNLYEVSPIRDSENMQINDINISQKVLDERKYSNNSNSKYYNNKSNHIENQSQNLLNNNKISERYNYLKPENIVKKVNKLESDLGYNYIKIENEGSNEILIEPKVEENIQNNNNYKIKNLYLKFNNKNLDKNKYHNYIQNSDELKSSLTNLVNEHSKALEDLINDSFKDKNYKSNQFFSSEQLESQNNYNNTKKFDYIKTNSILSVKLKEIRIKLSKEFYKHLIQICKIYIKKHFLFFIKQIKNNNENIYFHNKLNNFDGYKEIISTSSSVDVYKNTTLNKNETIYRKINKRAINDNKLNSNNISLSSKNKYYIKSVPRIKKLKDLSINKSNMSVQRNPNNKLLESNSLSPSLRIGNRIIINRDISFKNEGTIKENELYRDSRELNKKYRQIQTRKIRSKNKNSINKKNNITASENILKVEIKSDIDSQFNEIRKYIKSVKKERKNHNKNKSGKRIINKIINNNTGDSIKINTIEPNERNNYNSNILNNNYDFSNQTYDRPKYSKNGFNLNKNKSFNIKNNNTIINSNSINYNNTNVNNYNINKSNHLNNINNDSQQSSTFNSLSSTDFIIKNKNIYYSKDIQGKTIKLQNIKKINTNNSFNGPQKYNLYSSNRNHLYNSKNSDNEPKKNSSKRIKVFSMLIKNIVTKDKRIYITITYYFLLRKNKPLINRYDYLVPSEIYSLNLVCNNKNYNSKENLKLSEIKEEEFQNSKFYPEVQKMNFEKILNDNYDKKITKYFRNENIYEESDNYGKKSKNKINNNQ